jgi:colanic acid biosynthesis glycosyl transferase WcaI
MRIQLWSYNYDPEPTGIGPMSRVWAEGMRDLGHEVDVVAAHPHYPVPIWGRRARPYREIRHGIRVLRLPLWIGRATSAERYRQELTYMAAQFAALPVLGTPDVVVSGSPSFPALLPAMVNARLRRVSWVLWLHDILPDAATATGLVDEGWVLEASRWLERKSYRAADRIVVPAPPFVENLRRKSVPAGKVRVVGYPATRVPKARSADTVRSPTPRLLTMGNIGHSQGLARLVRAFEANASGCDSVSFVIAGEGVAANDVRSEIRSGRVEMPGVLDDERLESELHRATIAVVSQSHTGSEFNIPSKMMNFMAYGLPILAAVDPRGEVARIVERSQAGWVVDSSRPEFFPAAVAAAVRDPAEIASRGLAAALYARDNFSRPAFARHFDDVLAEVRPRPRT